MSVLNFLSALTFIIVYGGSHDGKYVELWSVFLFFFIAKLDML
jgi:hypothetical protein